MMKLVRTGIIAAFTTTGTVSAALLGTVADSGRFQLRDNANFRIFARSLGLSNSAARELADRYGQAATDPEILEVACLTAHGALGEAQVDTSPLSQTVVDMNWYGYNILYITFCSLYLLAPAIVFFVDPRPFQVRDVHRGTVLHSPATELW